jgi:hypothetical protein
MTDDAEELAYFTEALKRLDALRERAPKDSWLAETVTEARADIGRPGRPPNRAFPDLPAALYQRETASPLLSGHNLSGEPTCTNTFGVRFCHRQFGASTTSRFALTT